MRLGLSSDSTRLLVASCAEGGTDSVRMRTNAPLCIGTMSCDLPSCASEDLASEAFAPAPAAARQRQASASAVNLGSNAKPPLCALAPWREPSSLAQRRGGAKGRFCGRLLLLIGFTSSDDPDLHLARGLEVFHVHAREVARRAARAPRPRAFFHRPRARPGPLR